ncbi:MAG: hypothetical protein NC343_02580 [Muribaculum sp.]|nr:hypothetical protein [Muribaculaceae bacterium]MCM1080612.1 hypothetical protein [Muribaculum sp.]
MLNCNKIKLLLSTLFLSMFFSSCFTGIESTPKITAKHVSREGVESTLLPEETFLHNVTGDSLGMWQAGKQFFVTDSRISIAFEPAKHEMPKQGETIRFSHFNEVPSMTGINETEIVFLSNDTLTCVYRVNAPLNELKARRNGVEIPFTIEMSVVEKARKMLVDSVMYIRTPVWYNSDGKYTINGRKFIPVKIVAVEPGNLVYPLRVCFQPVGYEDHEPACVYMSVSDNSKSGRNFAMLFSLNDPRLRYPEITDEVWGNIQNSRVAKYMTRDECRIALGAPKSVQRRNAITSLQELWTYENGIYLMFEDGILQSFRQ